MQCKLKQKDIIEYLLKKLSMNPNVELYNKPDLPVLSFNVVGEESTQVASYLNRNNVCVRAGLHCAPLAHQKFNTNERGTVRVSPSYFNDLNEADRLIFLLKRY